MSAADAYLAAAGGGTVAAAPPAAAAAPSKSADKKKVPEPFTDAKRPKPGTASGTATSTGTATSALGDDFEIVSRDEKEDGAGGGDATGDTTDPDARQVVEEIWEWQRAALLKGWGPPSFIDPPPWTDANNKKKLSKETFPLPTAHWVWAHDWIVDLTANNNAVDADGWSYSLTSRLGTAFRPKDRTGDQVRRRRWVRPRIYYGPHTGTCVCSFCQIPAGESVGKSVEVLYEMALEDLSDIVERLEREPLALAPAAATATDAKSSDKKSSKSSKPAAVASGGAKSEVMLFTEQLERCQCCRHWMHKNTYTSPAAARHNRSLAEIENRAVQAIKTEFMRHAQTAIHDSAVIVGLQQLLTLLEVLRPSTAAGAAAAGATRDRDELIAKILGVRWAAYGAVFDPERHWTSADKERADAVRLGGISRRWLWIERQLREYDSHFGRVVPSSWHVRRQLLLGFAELTAKHIAFVLQATCKAPTAKDGAINPALVASYGSEFSAALESVIQFETEHKLNTAIVAAPIPTSAAPAASAPSPATTAKSTKSGIGAAVPLPPSVAHPIARAFVPFMFVLVERERIALLGMLSPSAADAKAGTNDPERWDYYEIPSNRVVSPPRFSDRIFVQLRAALQRVTTKLPAPLRDVTTVNSFVRVLIAVLQRYANLLHARTVVPSTSLLGGGSGGSSVAKRLLNALSPTSSNEKSAVAESEDVPRRDELIINCVVANTADYVLELIPQFESTIEALRTTLTAAAAAASKGGGQSAYAKYSAPPLSPVSQALAEFDSYRDIGPGAAPASANDKKSAAGGGGGGMGDEEVVISEFEGVTTLLSQTLSGAIAAILSNFDARSISVCLNPDRVGSSIAGMREVGDVSLYMKRLCTVLESEQFGIPMCGRLMCEASTPHVSLLNALYTLLTTGTGAASGSFGRIPGAILGVKSPISDVSAHQLRIDFTWLKTCVVSRVTAVRADSRSGSPVSDPAANARLARFQKLANAYFGKVEGLLKALPAISATDYEPKLNILTELIPKANVTDVAWLFAVRACPNAVIDWALAQYNALIPAADQMPPILNHTPSRPILAAAPKPSADRIASAPTHHSRHSMFGELDAPITSAGGGGGGRHSRRSSNEIPAAVTTPASGAAAASSSAAATAVAPKGGNKPARPTPVATVDPYANVDPNLAYAAGGGGAGGSGPKAVIIESSQPDSPDAMTKIKNFFSF